MRTPDEISIHDIADASTSEADAEPEAETSAATAQQEAEPEEVQEDAALQAEGEAGEAGSEDEQPEAEADAEVKSDAEEDAEEDAVFDPETLFRELNIPIDSLPEEARTPEMERRIANFAYGIQRLVEQQKQAKEQLTILVESLEPYGNLVDRLANPATAKDAYLELGRRLERELGVTLGVDEYDYLATADEDENDISSVKAAALAAIEEKYGVTLKELQEEHEKRQAEARLREKIDKVAPTVIGYLKRTEAGWPVSKDMLVEAARQFPQIFEEDPARAVKAAFPDSLAEHKAKLVASKTAKRGPEMPKSQGAKSVPIPKGKNPDELNIHELYETLRYTQS